MQLCMGFIIYIEALSSFDFFFFFAYRVCVCDSGGNEMITLIDNIQYGMQRLKHIIVNDH